MRAVRLSYYAWFFVHMNDGGGVSLIWEWMADARRLRFPDAVYNTPIL